MNKTIEYLDKLKAAYSVDSEPASDYRIAKLLKINTSTIYGYRAKRSRMNDSTALKAASLLGLPLTYVLAELHIESAKDDDERQLWQELKTLH